MKKSAGLLLFRSANDVIEVLLVHPGGPFWASKDAAAWSSIPKGEFEQPEEPLEAAKREFSEEIGRPTPDGEYQDLGSAKQPGGKVVYAWAVAASIDATDIKSNTLSIEWPPRSGKRMEIPEVDRAEWFSLDVAQTKLVRGQVPLLEALAINLGHALSAPPSADAQARGDKPVQNPLF